MKTRVANRLAELRNGRGFGAAELAGRVGVSRQTIYAIEAGTYVPNTEVALHLARELEVSVDELFSLKSEEGAKPATIEAEVLSSGTPSRGQPVRICQVGSRWVGVPVSATPNFLPDADGVIEQTGHGKHRAGIAVFGKPGKDDRV